MKKNIMTVGILALSFINFVLLTVIMFVLVPSANKTNKLVSQVASIVDLELETEKKEQGTDAIKIEDRDTYVIEQDLTVNLKSEVGSTKESYALIKKVSVTTNKKAKSYKQLQPTIATNETMITDTVRNVFHNYTVEEAKLNEEQIKADILKELQKQYDDEFIIDISFGNLTYKN